MTTSSGGAGAVRSHLIDALEADLVGPFRKPPGAAVSDAPKVLRISPSGWYLTGFLVPRDQGGGSKADAHKTTSREHPHFPSEGTLCYSPARRR